MARTPKAAKVQPIAEEHTHLRETMSEFRLVLVTRAAAQSQVAMLLNELTQQVLEHFDHEESEGYFTEVINVAPRLSERADALLAEHVQLAQHLIALRRCAETEFCGAPWWQTLEHEFGRFLASFSAHEQAENQLLQEAYLDDIGAED